METVEAYYEAEEQAEISLVDDPVGPSDPADVPAYFARALESAGYDPVPGPVILWDVEGDSRWFGYVDDEGIHLHPRMFRPVGLLHELAHWIDPRGGHTSRWAYIYLELVTNMLGQEAAAAFPSRRRRHLR